MLLRMTQAVFDKVTALNSKGLRPDTAAGADTAAGQSNCPEFKGIKTPSSDELPGPPQDKVTALNSKGLRH